MSLHIIISIVAIIFLGIIVFLLAKKGDHPKFHVALVSTIIAMGVFVIALSIWKV